MKYTVIYHKNCLDGFMSLVICKKFLKSITPLPDVPSAMSIPDVKNKDIFIVDVAYKPEIIKEIIKLAKSVVMIDHHITHHEEISNIKNSKFNYIYSTDHQSAALLTWNYFSKENPPISVEYISDNDTGTWKYKETLNFISALNVKYPIDEKNIKKWFKLFTDTEVKKLVIKGRAYVEYNNYLTESKSNHYATMKFPSEEILKIYPKLAKSANMYTIAIHNGSCPTTTLLGNFILKKTKCDICFIYTYNIIDDVYIISMRSKNIDVSNIAKQFGGGGHQEAAAFKYSGQLHFIFSK